MTTLVVFDYDWSLINENSDTWIFRQLSPELLEEVARRRSSGSWTQLMDEMLGELVARRPELTRDDIRGAVADIPVQPRMLDAVRLAVEGNGAVLKIISDANTVYIDSMLKHHKIEALVSEVFTNPATFEGETARLSVRPYHPLNEAPHGCPNCPPNMCKGKRRILAKIRETTTFDRVIYIGDGGGDFCPSTLLSSRDIVLARADDEDGKAYGLLKKLTLHADEIKARVVPWRTGQDIFDQFSSAFQAHM
ncbi:hypothetical protein ATCC90586_001274 [Pythium insidiosum]|nr:hypothetical protein ATCC90586_001274 [Pythium insidiosum]